MKLSSAAVALLTTSLPASTLSQECIVGGFTLEFEGACSAEAVHEAYADQVFDAAGALPDGCTAEADLNAKLAAAGLGDASALCDQVYATQEKVPFYKAANRGTDMKFEEFFFNGRTDWQEEVETLYENEDGTATSILKQDAEMIDAFYDSKAQGARVAWPGELPNFKSSVTDADGLPTCTTNAAMCCWPKDRQANDNNGNCAKPYDQNCVDKDPADNTDLCYVDLERGNVSTGREGTGFVGFPGDNNEGEGSIHCHGLAWSNDVNDMTARYKGNNIFYVAMYDHMYVRGYVRNIPGAPMCGCVEQMPTVSRSDCTQVDLTETISITFDAATPSFDSKLTSVYVDFNACRGINNRNNDLWAYLGKLYYQEDITPEQYGEAGRIITNTGCEDATRYALNTMSLTRGYDHDIDTWTLVAGRDDLFDGHPYGREAFNTVFFGHSLTKPASLDVAAFDAAVDPSQTPIIMRICPQCTDTHKYIFYRRLTPVAESFDLLNNILYHRNDGNGDNRWGEDFTLHSTYDDAKTGANPWKCNNDAFNYGAPFYGECSPTGARVTNQYSIWNWHPGPQPDVAYYVNTPEGVGVSELGDASASAALALTGDYSSADLGMPYITGRVFERPEDGAIIVSGGGYDIWGYHDAGHFLSRPASGDVDMIVHVAKFTGLVNSWAKAGLMIRGDGDADAPWVFAQLTASYGSFLGVRYSKGRYAESVGNRYQLSPTQTTEWLRLIKRQDVVTMYVKDEAGEWLEWASVSVRFPEDNFLVGLAVTSHHNSYVSEATFTDFSVDEYYFPTASPSISAAPTAWDPEVAVGGGSRVSTVNVNTDNGITYYRGYGTGLWGTSDNFFYHNWQRELSDGAFDIVVWVERFHTGYQTAKGGIMIRDNNGPESAHAFLGMKGYYQGVSFESRATAGAKTDHHQTIFVSGHKGWIRLHKAADSGVITAYYKILEADEWMEIGSTDVEFTGNALQAGVAMTVGMEDSHTSNRYVDLQTKSLAITDAAARKMLLRA